MKETFNATNALQLITKAIESGSIKPRGSHDSNTVEYGEDNAKIDAAYLLTLLNELQKPPTA